MENEKKPIFPIVNMHGAVTSNDEFMRGYIGLTKREYTIIHLAAIILPPKDAKGCDSESDMNEALRKWTRHVTRCADALLTELNKTK